MAEMTDMRNIMPKSTVLRNRKVVALAFDGMPLFEFSIAVEIFGLDRPEMGPNWYQFAVARFDDEPARTTAGLMVNAPAPLEVIEDAGTIILPGWPLSKPDP